MKKNKLHFILTIVLVALVVISIGLLIGTILLNCLDYELSYSLRENNLVTLETPISVVTIVLSGISLIISPFVLAFTKKKCLPFLYVFFLLAAGGVALGEGIATDGAFAYDQELVIAVFGAIEIFIGVLLFALTILRLIFKEDSKPSKSNALKSLDNLKKEGIISEEEYAMKKEQIEEKEKEVKVDPNVCPKCGHVRRPNEKFCAECGSKFEEVPVHENVPSVETREPKSALTQVAEVFFYIGVVVTCITVIGLCWALPMLHIYKRDRDTIGKHSLAFKICTLLFVSEVGGILMLIDYKH